MHRIMRHDAARRSALLLPFPFPLSTPLQLGAASPIVLSACLAVRHSLILFLVAFQLRLSVSSLFAAVA